jgi:general secretion pathway protein J
MTTRADRTGFTLLEVLLALGVTAALLVIVMGGLRVGLAAWQRGAERTAALDRERSLVVMIERSLAGAFPYRISAETEQEARVVFDGRPDRLTFVTLAPPLPADAPAPFSAVSLAADATGLALRQQILPNRLALDGMEPVLVDRQTTAVRFRYLGQEPEAWAETWDVKTEEALPRAVEVTLVTGVGTRRAQQTLTVPIRASTP